MKTHSNIPFPDTPQLWRDGQYVHYYNKVDNGEDFAGNRYEADYVIVTDTSSEGLLFAEQWATDNPELARMIADGEFVWHVPAKIQVLLSHAMANRMILENPMLFFYMTVEQIAVRHDILGVYIYASYLLPEHRQLFEGVYGAKITERP